MFADLSHANIIVSNSLIRLSQMITLKDTHLDAIIVTSIMEEINNRKTYTTVKGKKKRRILGQGTLQSINYMLYMISNESYPFLF